MDLELSDEQLWLAESVNRLLETSEAPAIWPALLDFGVREIAIGADGLGAIELALISHQLGRRLAAIPFIETAAALYATRGEEVSDQPAVAGLRAGTGTATLA